MLSAVLVVADEEKALELGELESIPEPDEVRVARDELMALTKEKERTERLKKSLEKELENAKDRAARLEEVRAVRERTRGNRGTGFALNSQRDE